MSGLGVGVKFYQLSGTAFSTLTPCGGIFGLFVVIGYSTGA
jgi:hypothetical protein